MNTVIEIKVKKGNSNNLIKKAGISTSQYTLNKALFSAVKPNNANDISSKDKVKKKKKVIFDTKRVKVSRKSIPVT